MSKVEKHQTIPLEPHGENYLNLGTCGIQFFQLFFRLNARKEEMRF